MDCLGDIVDATGVMSDYFNALYRFQLTLRTVHPGSNEFRAILASTPTYRQWMGQNALKVKNVDSECPDVRTHLTPKNSSNIDRLDAIAIELCRMGTSSEDLDFKKLKALCVEAYQLIYGENEGRKHEEFWDYLLAKFSQKMSDL